MIKLDKTSIDYINYVNILKEELVPAMGCTEPIALAYCASKCRDVLNDEIVRIEVFVSGNIIKNVKSVIVPNTGGLKGIEASIAIGITGGKTEKELEVISEVDENQKEAIVSFLNRVPIVVSQSKSEEALDIQITCFSEKHKACVQIVKTHTNIKMISKDDEILFENNKQCEEGKKTTKECLTVEKIVDFANTVEIEDVKDVLDRQIAYNIAIAKEGLTKSYGANIGNTLLKAYGTDVSNVAKAYAAAGSDARMNGCELPVIINSGSGNQGITVSVPVIVYAKQMHVSDELLYRALIVSNLCAIHLKTGIGRLSAYCGAVSAGVGAGCGIAYLHNGDFEVIAHTLVNAISIGSGIICDGAKASCAGKIALSVEAGILGYHMYCNGQEFKSGDGLVVKGVEKTIKNIGRLGSIGMKETDKEIIDMMCNC